MMSLDGEIEILPHSEAALRLHKQAAIVCHAPTVKAQLSLEEFQAFDVLELFAFTHPARFTIPTPKGLAVALGCAAPESFEDFPMTLMEVVQALLSDLQNDPLAAKAAPSDIARLMGLQGKGWVWTPFVLSALGQSYDPAVPVNGKATLNVWKNLPEWAEEAPEPPPSHFGLEDGEVRDKLRSLLGAGAEEREQQALFATKIAKAFEPPTGDDEDAPIHTVLAEAGTGVGKTMGYLTPAALWAEKNQGSVWISTYTKNLQRQINQELNRIYKTPEVKDAHVAIRKGRENYLCLLNLEDLAAGAGLARTPQHAIAAGIMARWAAATKDGDLGGDFPAWLAKLLGFHNTLGLADKRGECIYSACDHYRKCFVEHSVRKSARARIVVSNHALTMINAALAGGASEDFPTRLIFDEGHHIFDAADSAFAAHLSARETRDLRRWILGAEGGKRSRARGLARRTEGLVEGDETLEKALQNALMAAHVLTGEGWGQRFKNRAPFGPCEEFLLAVYHQVYARTPEAERNAPFSIETQTLPLEPGVAEKAAALQKALKELQTPLQTLAKLFRQKLADDKGEMEGDLRKRYDTLATSMERRATMALEAWSAMLATLSRHPDQAQRAEGSSQADQENRSLDYARDDTVKRGNDSSGFIDWMEIERADGKAQDVGLYRHYIDPARPFAASVKPHIHGIAVTSATLRDATEDEGENWLVAQERTGTGFLHFHPHRESFSSPFSYADQTKVYIIQDVNKQDIAQVAGAYRTLFQASEGGALGLFTAIQRLRAVHERIHEPLEQDGLHLYAQHVDEMDSGTLVDMFREDTHACLLGTDAVRDGVDVPGESLRLIVFDRTPWPRPTILHKARREAFGARRYDEMITRLKLKQAFGRLIRRAGDKGVFVMLDSMLPSRLHGAFPENVVVEKVTLQQARVGIEGFLKDT